MQLWNQQDDKVQHIIDALLNSMSDKGLKFTLTTEILCRELIYSTSQELGKGTIIEILSDLKANNKNSLEDFNQAFTRVIRRKPNHTKCTVILPYENIIFKTPFNISGKNYKIVRENRLALFVNYKKIQSSIKSHILPGIRDIKFPQKLLITQGEANNVFVAWERIRNNFSVFQGIYDYGLLQDNWSFSNSFKPKSVFNHSEWIIIEKENGKNEIGLFENYVSGKNPIIKPAIIERVRNLLNYVRNDASSESTKSLIYDSFRLYAQAMESLYEYNCFLNLWQLIENSCMADQMNGNTADIIKRLDVIKNEMLGQLDLDLTNTYSFLAKKRNNIVHRGIDDVDEVDINISKVLAEACVGWLIKHEKILKSKIHIQEYFRHRTKGKREKIAILETIKYIST